MRINEIIVEDEKQSDALQKKMDAFKQERNVMTTYANSPELPYVLAAYKRANITTWSDAVDAGFADYAAIQRRKNLKRVTGKLNKDGSDKEKELFRVKTDKDDKPEGPGRGKYTQYRDGSDRAGSQDFGGDGSGTGAKIAKAINPLTGIDTTDFGTVATSAARKARSKMKNLDKFKIQKR